LRFDDDPGMYTTAVDQRTREAEIEAIKQVIARREHSQHNEPPEEFAGLFRGRHPRSGGRRDAPDPSGLGQLPVVVAEHLDHHVQAVLLLDRPAVHALQRLPGSESPVVVTDSTDILIRGVVGVTALGGASDTEMQAGQIIGLVTGVGEGDISDERDLGVLDCLVLAEAAGGDLAEVVDGDSQAVVPGIGLAERKVTLGGAGGAGVLRVLRAVVAVVVAPGAVLPDPARAILVAGLVQGLDAGGAEAELFSSDLRRTLRTAGEVAKLFGVRPIPDRGLREKSYGEAEGRAQEWLDRRFIPPPAAGERMEHDEGVKGAETKAAWARRVYAAMDEILRHPCEHQIIVTHGGTLTFVVASWIRMPIESAGHASFPVPPGSITTLREDDFFHNRHVVSLGDTRHLPPAQAG
jgi:probable phosphoglycerate mutase